MPGVVLVSEDKDRDALSMLANKTDQTPWSFGAIFR